jgi:hypothetical protein
LSAHERVIDAARRLGTVLPIRFGVLMDSEETVIDELLRGRHQLLSSMLADMAGKAEVRVQASYLPDVALRDAVATEPAILRLRSRLAGRSTAATYYDRIRLGEMVAAAVERVRAGDAASLARPFADLAIDTRPLPARSEHIAMNTAFLLDEADIPKFEGVLTKVADEQSGRLKFRVVGPLAPWDFVAVELNEEAGSRGRRRPVGARGT